MPEHAVPLRVTIEAPGLDLDRTLRFALRSPTGVRRSDGIWRATRTPLGPATIRYARTGPAIVTAQAWGPGARWAIDVAPEAIGATDDAGLFGSSADVATLRHPLVRDLHKRMPGVRIPRTRAVFETLTWIILEQKVQGGQARRAYKALVWKYGEAAPGPGATIGLRVPPSPETIARIPAWAFHSLNVERKRAVTITAAARYAERIDECVDLPIAQAYERLTTLPGIGLWSAAEVAAVALGDADAVSVGDFHLKNTVAHALAGDIRATDERMLELLEPWRGHRARVVKLIEMAGIRAPKFGPRLTLQDIRGL